MKSVEITNQRSREDRGGGIVVNFDYVVTDDLGQKKAGSGSLGVARSSPSDDDMKVIIDINIRSDVARRLGFKTFDFIPMQPRRKTLGLGKP